MTTRSKQKKAQAGGRGKGWSTTELDIMLSVVDQLMLIGPNQWEAVQLAYARRLPKDHHVRDTEAVKCKFYKLKNMPIPTGDPNCPEAVRRAKRTFRQIENRGGVLELDDDADDDADDVVAQDAPAAPTDAHRSEPTQPAIESPSPAPSPAATPADDTASAQSITRSGLLPAELTSLSSTLAASRASTVSQSAQKRRRLDAMLDRLEAEEETFAPTNLAQLFVEMEERSRQRELEYQRERDEREMRRAERETARDQVMMALLAKITGACDV